MLVVIKLNKQQPLMGGIFILYPLFRAWIATDDTGFFLLSVKSVFIYVPNCFFPLNKPHQL